MFDAVIAKKARMETILHEAKRHPREDLVTSSLFGMLRLLTPDARRDALSALCGHDLSSDAKIHLWPYFAAEGESSEPDVVLEFEENGQRFYWIVEVKWGAPLGADQCAREIRTVAGGKCRRGNIVDGKRKVLGYTLLGAEDKHQKAMADLRKMVKDGPIEGIGAPHIRSLGWTDAVERLRCLQGEARDPGLRAWSRLCADFLSGEPQGAVLGEWPAMTMAMQGSFAFDDEERFFLPQMAAVPTIQYIFRENK